MRGWILDFDGVIVDSEPLRYQTYVQLFKDEYGIDIGNVQEKILGKNQYQTIPFLLEKHALKGDVDTLVAKRAKLLEKISPPLLPGVKAFLERCEKKAIASSSDRASILRSITTHNLPHIPIITVEQVAHGKPAPDLFLAAAEAIGCAPEACTVIEDSVAGIHGAKKAGMQVIALTTSLPKEKLQEAERVIDSFEELDGA